MLMNLRAVEHLYCFASASQDPSTLFEHTTTLQMQNKLFHVVVNCASHLLHVIRQKRMEVKQSLGFIIRFWEVNSVGFN